MADCSALRSRNICVENLAPPEHNLFWPDLFSGSLMCGFKVGQGTACLEDGDILLFKSRFQ